jgi:hypothetical protein
MRRYHIQGRDDYKKYNKLVGQVTKLTALLKQLDPQDAARIQITEDLIKKLEALAGGGGGLCFRRGGRRVRRIDVLLATACVVSVFSREWLLLVWPYSCSCRCACWE